ncbi:MAG: NADH-quinone oxidoreductase subunit M [Dehalococcoidia bacterium]|nr:NADH-quinone oxidoreductase subunit M [Dehalococcoidia bacterium]
MILFVTILLPFAAGLLLALFPRDRHREIRVFSTIIGAALAVLGAVIFSMYDYEEGGYQFTDSFQWLDAPLNISLSLGLDGISAPMVLLTGIVVLAATMVSWNVQHRPRDFFVLLMMLVAGVYGVFVVRDLFFLFFFYELAVLPMYLLIGVWGSSSDFGAFLRPKEYGALKLVLFLVAGSVLVWTAILGVYWAAANAGTPTFLIEAVAGEGSDLQEVDFNEGFKHFQTLFFPLFMVGFGVLAGLWPFHTWSPDGHVAAPTAVSMLHAGVLMKLGAYGIIRVGMVLLPEGAETWMPVLIGLGTVNVLYGAVSALAQRDLKYVVGYSSVSHMGYVLMGMATLDRLGVGGAVLQMFSHGIMTALFFALVGVIYDRAHVRDIGVLGGLSKRMGVTAAFFAVAGLASLGLPGLSGFVAEFLVFVGTFRTYLPLAVLAVIGAAITAVYILRLLASTFFGPMDPRWEHLGDASRLEMGAAGMLVVTLVFVGVWPLPFMDVINSGVADLLVRYPA